MHLLRRLESQSMHIRRITSSDFFLDIIIVRNLDFESNRAIYIPFPWNVMHHLRLESQSMHMHRITSSDFFLDIIIVRNLDFESK
jgi:hypothetical protein